MFASCNKPSALWCDIWTCMGSHACLLATNPRIGYFKKTQWVQCFSESKFWKVAIDRVVKGKWNGNLTLVFFFILKCLSKRSKISEKKWTINKYKLHRNKHCQ